MRMITDTEVNRLMGKIKGEVEVKEIIGPLSGEPTSDESWTQTSFLMVLIHLS